MIRACSVCSLRVKFNVNLVKWEGFIKFTEKCFYTERERERGRVVKSLLKQIWKFKVNEIKYFYICIRFLMYKISLWQLKLVSSISIFAINITIIKNYQKCFLIYQKKFILPSSSLFSSLFMTDFIDEIDWWQILKFITSLCL